MSKSPGCCLCGNGVLATQIKLEALPLSHHLRQAPSDPDPRFEVAFAACHACGLLQIPDPIPADVLYAGADTYTTGFQRPKHLEDLITTAIAHQDPGQALDVGCNDGALLAALAAAGHSAVVGVEPNRVAAQMARDKGYRVYTDYLSAEVADRLIAEHGRFDSVYTRHVIEHVSDLSGFFTSLRKVLKPSGLLVMELPDVEVGFEMGSPAILWEEHVNYLTFPLAEAMLNRFGFRVLDRRRYVFGGGSMAFVAQRVDLPAPASVVMPDPKPAIAQLDRFAQRMAKQTEALASLVGEARAAGYQIVMYGAAPRSCLVSSTSGIGDSIDVVIDDRQEIQDRLMPGTPVGIRPLARAVGDLAPKVLCLLGVGAENEFKVRAKLEAATSARIVFVSLFPPRDTLDSVARARSLICK